jgi:hypothetical protein
MNFQSESRWPSIRRNLIVMIVLLAGVSIISLLSARPGDFAAGLPGAVLCGGAAAIVVLGELIVRGRRRS